MRALGISPVLIGVLSVPIVTTGGVGAQPKCLHGVGEAAPQRTRRAAAIRLARAVNTAEMNGPRRTGGPYQSIAQLGIDTVAVEGFESAFTTDDAGYALIL